MAEQPASPDDVEATERQLEGFIARFDPEIAERTRACRAALRERLPAAEELVYDNYNALAIGFGSSGRLSDVIVSLAVFPRGVSLYFLHGRSLPDPHAILQGEGSQGAYVRLLGPETLSDARVAALLDAALAHAARPLPPSGSRRTVVKSISARQRPRRAPAKEPA